MDLRKLQPESDLLDSMTAPMPAGQAGSNPGLPSGATDEEKLGSLLKLIKGRTANSREDLFAVRTKNLTEHMVAGIVLLLMGFGIIYAGFILDGLFFSLLLSVVPLIYGARILIPLPGVIARHRDAIRMLMRYDDQRVLSPLIQALGFPDSELRQEVRADLTIRLANIDPDRANRLSKEDCARLSRYLTPRYASRYPEFVGAIVYTMRQIGDTTSYEAIRRFVQQRSRDVTVTEVQKRASEQLSTFYLDSSRISRNVSNDFGQASSLQTSGMVDGTGADAMPWLPVIATLTEIQKQQQRIKFSGVAAYLAFVFLVLVGAVLSPPDVNMHYAPAAGICHLIFCVIMLLTDRAFTSINQRKERETLDALAKITSQEAIGPLLEAYTGRVYPSKVREKLIDLLNSQNSTEHANLSTSHRKLLYRQVATSESVPLQRACIKTMLLLDGNPPLFPLARLVVRDAPTKEEQVLREEARQALATIVGRMDFGTVADIPHWVAQLPEDLIPGVTISEEEREASTVAVFALIHLLPQLTPAHAGLLNAAARLRLKDAQAGTFYMLICDNSTTYLSALSRFGPEFALAWLTALEAVGQGSDLAFVSGTATMQAASPALQQIRARARQLVPILTERRKAEEVSNVLLRGASAPPAPSNQLLRAATGNPLSEPAIELLRPENAAPLPAVGAATTEEAAPKFVVNIPSEEPLINRSQL